MSSSVLNPGNHITSPEQQQQQPSAIIEFSSAVAFVSTCFNQRLRICTCANHAGTAATSNHQELSGQGPIGSHWTGCTQITGSWPVQVCPSLWCSGLPPSHVHLSMQTYANNLDASLSFYISIIILLQCHATSLKLATRTETTVVFHPSAIPRARNANGNQTGPTGLINMTLKLLYRNLYVTLLPI